MEKVITITSDFKDEFAVAQLHAVAVSLGFDGKLIENHGVTPYSIIEGAFQILSLSKFTPKGTVHLGVVDPGVGSDRRGIIIKNHQSWFIGPDNGLLYPAAKSTGADRVWQINEKAVSKNSSNTFHGRDVFLKAAIFISQGKHPSEFGSIKILPSQINKLSIKHGQILHVDAYGNVKIFWKQKIKTGTKLKFLIKGKTQVFPVVKTFSNVNKGCNLAYLGSNDTLELAINLGNLAIKSGLKTGDILKQYKKCSI